MSFRKAWIKEESNNIGDSAPHHINNIIVKDASEFIQSISRPSYDSYKYNLVKSIYAGDAYILKNAFSQDYLMDLKHEIYEWGKETPAKFHKMLDGCPDYHIINDKVPKGESDYRSTEHSYVFFRWNKSITKLFQDINQYFEMVKIISGQKPNAYVDSIPSDGIIDRLSFLHYPHNVGEITKHYDSAKYQKMLVGATLTEMGVDYPHGEYGFYLVDKHNKKIHMENIASLGDLICVYPTLYHGVTIPRPTDGSKKIDWSDIGGRWYLQIYSPESHEVKDREYTTAIND
jgi:hypothetical protein